MIARLAGGLICAALTAPAFAAIIPRQASDIAIVMPGGNVVKPSQFRGKVVVLELLLTTCPHCQRASQTLDRIYKDLGPKGFQPLGAAINDDTGKLVPEYVAKFNISYPIGRTTRDTAVEFLQHPIMQSLLMPQIVIIDRAGNIRAQYSGDDKFFAEEEKNLRDIIQRLLAEGGASKKSSTKKK
jgi:thiol-disulfide isomerase/thioredoxin